MFGSSEYHVGMQSRIPRPALLLALFAAPAFLLGTAHAQINGTPSSVTSSGFGGRAVNGPPASVTSLGPRGYSPGPRATFSTVPNVPHDGHNGDAHHHHRNQGQYYAPLLYAYPYGYGYDDQNAPPPEDNADNNDANYQGGPTIFDRRGSGERSYVPPVKDAAPYRPAEQMQPADQTYSAESAPEPAADPTMLVFRDGHKVEVANYAIVGATLFDLTPGHPRKIALADLDIPATQKQNDDRGVLFQLPPSARVN